MYLIKKSYFHSGNFLYFNNIFLGFYSNVYKKVVNLQVYQNPDFFLNNHRNVSNFYIFLIIINMYFGWKQNNDIKKIQCCILWSFISPLLRFRLLFSFHFTHYTHYQKIEEEVLGCRAPRGMEVDHAKGSNVRQ